MTDETLVNDVIGILGESPEGKEYLALVRDTFTDEEAARLYLLTENPFLQGHTPAQAIKKGDVIGAISALHSLISGYLV